MNKLKLNKIYYKKVDNTRIKNVLYVTKLANKLSEHFNLNFNEILPNFLIDNITNNIEEEYIKFGNSTIKKINKFKDHNDSLIFSRFIYLLKRLKYVDAYQYINILKTIKLDPYTYQLCMIFGVLIGHTDHHFNNYVLTCVNNTIYFKLIDFGHICQYDKLFNNNFTQLTNNLIPHFDSDVSLINEHITKQIENILSNYNNILLITDTIKNTYIEIYGEKYINENKLETQLKYFFTNILDNKQNFISYMNHYLTQLI